MKPVFWLIGFLLLAGIGDRVGGGMLNELLASSQFRYSRLYAGTAQSDIVLIGNSRGLGFYQPYLEEVTGKTTLNLSYNSLSVDLAAVLIEDYIRLYGSPRLVVIDISICDRVNHELISQFSCYQGFSGNLKGLIRDSIPHTALATSISHLYQYNSEIFQRALYYLQKSDEDWLLDRTITQDLINKVEDPTYEYHILYPAGMPEKLGAITRLLESKSIPYRLVVPPYYPTFRERLTDLDALIQAVQIHTGAKVHDYSTSVTDRSAFGDLQHVNKKGAKAFIAMMKNDGILD